MKKSHYKYFILITLFITIALSIQIYISYSMNNKNRKEIINSKLLYAAQSIENILPEGYHNKNINKFSYSREDSISLFTKMDKVAKEIGVDYLYTLIISDGKLYYTSMSDSYENLIKEGPNYWYPLDDAEDSSLEATYNFFKNPRIMFLECSDKWGSYKSVYFPQYSKDGTLYLAGADILIESIQSLNFKKKMMLIANFLMLFFLFSPVLLAFSNLKKNDNEYKKKLHNLKHYDNLTNVYNRNSGLNIMNNHIELHERYGIPFSIFIIDIFNLEEINKKCGIETGDNLLRILAQLLKVTFTQRSKIIRIHGDNFIVLIPNYYVTTEKTYRRKLLEKINYFNKMNKKCYYLDISLAFLKYNGQGLDNFIESALHNIRISNINGSLYEINMQEMMEISLINKEFEVYLQPKINIKTKEISFEALLRWNKDFCENISPNVFIPIAEKGTLIFALTNFVINEVIKMIYEYNFEISVNLSPVMFQKEKFFSGLCKNLENFDRKSKLKFEITETSAFSDMQSTISKINFLRSTGIEFSLDDFGTGYSSLSYLNMLPVKEVKVDKSFINGLADRAENKLIIESVIRLGKILGFEVIIEGVENLEDIKLLVELGCDNFQGYYFGKAEPLPKCIEFIKRGHYKDKILNIN